jgi:putative ABC transport system substrate-binding protein
MKRRHFIAGLATTVILPVNARAQDRKTPLIGFLFPGPAGLGASRLIHFREGLHYSGWKDEQVKIAARFAENDVTNDRLFANELLEMQPEVLVAIAAVAVAAARAATNTTPIIAFDLETDPVAAGLASSLAHVSGVYFDFPDFSSKWIELLKEAIPAMKSISVVLDPASPSPQLKAIMAVAATLSVAVETMDMRDLDDVFRTASVRRPDAVVILSSPLIGMNPDRIADLTVKYRLPT